MRRSGPAPSAPRHSFPSRPIASRRVRREGREGGRGGGEGAEREARERYRIREEEIGPGFPKSHLTDLKDRVTL